ncbi:MAG TPA: HIT domain-containing protein [Bacteroidota bacterium]|nr:HIT domain-containing protein [Bacteroidota bacterium]
MFCRIVSGEIASEVLFENRHVVSILDINPIHFGHALVIPKAHYRDFLELDPECYGSLLGGARIVTAALVRGLDLEGFNLFSNNGRIAGQSVFHFHLHVTPRYHNDNIRFVLQLKKYRDGEMKRYADLIRHHIQSS